MRATRRSTAPTSGRSSASGSRRCPSRRMSGSWAASQAHEFMVLNPAGEDVLVLCEACGYAANRQVAMVPKPDPRGGGATAPRGGGDARHDDHRRACVLPRDRAFAHGQGRLLRDRRRPPRDRDRARRPRGQRDQARQCREGGRWHAAGHRRGDPRRGHGAGLRITGRRARHRRRDRRPRGTVLEPRRGRQPRRLPLPQRQRRP